jgi:hypothetical protein
VQFSATMLPCCPSPARICSIMPLVQAIRDGVRNAG